MTATSESTEYIAKISQGLPHYTHSLGLQAGRHALSERRDFVTMDDVTAALSPTIEAAQESIKTAYHKATFSSQKGNLFRQVLLASALTEIDDLGFFAANDLRPAMARLMSRVIMVNTYLQHLKKLTEDERGPVFEQIGSERRYRYRFINPLMRPYVIARGLQDRMISEQDLEQLGL